MTSQSMLELAQRMMNAHDRDARARELVSLAPAAMLARFGLAHSRSVMVTIAGITGAMALGAVVGAGAALVFAPTSGQELQRKLRKQAERFSSDVKKASDHVGAAVSVLSHTEAASHDATDHGAHA